MTSLKISDEDFSPLKNKVVVLTGGSSGIGLATVKLLLAQGARVVASDRSGSPSIEDNNLTFTHCDVTSWDSLKALFKTAIDKHGRVDHVFANAGIAGTAQLLVDEFDDQGELKQPSHAAFAVNLLGTLDTIRLALHHIAKNHGTPRGSIVLTASASSFQRFPVVDYTSSKHGVLGLMRGLHPVTGANSESGARINAISPSWTLTGLVPEDVANAAGIRSQTPEAAARSALKLMADESMHGVLVYSVQGKYTEVEEHMIDTIDKMLDHCEAEEPRTRSETAELYALIEHGIVDAMKKNKG